MKKGFYTIIAAQFVSSLADNALLIAAIAMLTVMKSASWITPLLQIFFTISYVLLAPFVGAFADALQKRHVMFISNALKAAGCAMMIAGVHPMIAYGVVGLGAAAYSPAKYGILTELLPPEKLIAANAWLESATVGSTILGTVIGGALVSQYVNHWVSACALAARAHRRRRRHDRRDAHLRGGGRDQRRHPGHGRALSEPADRADEARRRFLPLLQGAVVRQARADRALGHDASLGRGRHAATAGAQMGRTRTSACRSRRRRSCKA